MQLEEGCRSKHVEQTKYDSCDSLIGIGMPVAYCVDERSMDQHASLHRSIMYTGCALASILNASNFSSTRYAFLETARR